MGRIIAIDLGTTNCVVAVPEERTGEGFLTVAGCPGCSVILDQSGYASIPAVVAEDRWGNILVGRVAKARRGLRPRPIFQVRRYLGEDITLQLGSQGALRPEQVTAHILRALKEIAEARLDEEVDQAVIAVPAYFGLKAKAAIEEAAELADLKVTAFVTEPAAAMQAYLAGDPRDPLTVMSYDLGGGEFNVSIEQRCQGRTETLRISGDRYLGGALFDRLLAERLMERLSALGWEVPVMESPAHELLWDRLLERAEQAKQALSRMDRTVIDVESLGATDRAGNLVSAELTIERSEFEALISSEVERSVELCRQAISDAELAPDCLDEILLVGGSSTIPLVAWCVEKEFGRKPRLVAPDLCVALGAAILAPGFGEEQLETQAFPGARTAVPIDEAQAVLGNLVALSQSISTRLEDGHHLVVVPAGVPLPYRTTLSLHSTGASGEIRLPLYEGDALLGDFVIRNLPRDPASGSTVVVTLTIDERRALELSAFLPELNREARMEIELGVQQPLDENASVRGPERREETAHRLDQVHFTVTSPGAVRPSTSFVIDVWAHLQRQRETALKRAREAAVGGEIRVKSKGPVQLARGTVLTVQLRMEGLLVSEPEDTILWHGTVGNASFCVSVPQDAALGPRAGLARIYADGLQVARIDFAVEVGATQGEITNLPAHEAHHHRAFVCYASDDRSEVLKRIQGMQKAVPGMEVFLDVLSLRSGQYWEQELWSVIPTTDVFYLFWSAPAAQSPWVEKEWRCALQTRGLDFIDPVPLAPPEEVPPPRELAGKHFNDWVLAYLRPRAAA